MSHELLYTSAPQGLKPSSRGFCTVEMTEGIPPGLVDRLESLSGYRQAFPIHDPRAKDNPVNYSHLLVPAAGKRFHVLSRVADAGQDYTGRSNKLAHHVALEPQERPAGNPAWVLRSPGFCQTGWDGTPRVLRSGRRPPSGTRGPGPCLAWKQAAGDAGWAGVLVQAAMEPGAKSVSVIYPAGLDVLRLVEEALALVPGERQWEVTFSTYFTKLPAGIECQWRFLLEDSLEAQALRRNLHATALDLCRSPGAPPATPYAHAARAGRFPDMREVERPDSVLRRGAGAGSASPPPVPMPGTAGTAAATAPTTLAPPSTGGPRATTPSLVDALGGSPSRRKSNQTLNVVAAAVLLVAVSVGAVVYLSKGRVSVETSLLAQGERERIEREKRELAEEQRARQEKRKQEAEGGADAEAGTSGSEEASPIEPPISIPEDPPPAPTAKSQNLTPPLSDIRRQDHPKVGKYPLLALPQLDRGLGAPKDPIEIAKIYVHDTDRSEVHDTDPCGLVIHGSETLLGSGARFEVQPRSKPGAQTRVWDVVERVEQSLGSPPIIGTFTLSDDKLLFKWSSFRQAEGTNAHMLPYCLLLVSVGEDRELCALGKPRPVDPVTLDLDFAIHPRSIALGPSEQVEIPRTTDPRVRLDLWIEAPDDLPVLLEPNKPLSVSSETVVQTAVLIGTSHGDSKKECVELRVKFARVNGRLQLSFENFWFPEYVKDSNFEAPPWRFASQEAKAGEGFNRGDIKGVKGKEGKERKAAGFLNMLKRIAEQPDREITKREEEILAREDGIGMLDPQLRLANAAMAKYAKPEDAPFRLRQAKQSLDRAIKTHRDEIANRNAEIGHWNESRKPHENATKFGQANLEWCEWMTKLLNRIQSDVKIGYRVYVVLEDGGEIELVRTGSPDSRTKQAAPPLQLGM